MGCNIVKLGVISGGIHASGLKSEFKKCVHHTGGHLDVKSGGQSDLYFWGHQVNCRVVNLIWFFLTLIDGSRGSLARVVGSTKIQKSCPHLLYWSKKNILNQRDEWDLKFKKFWIWPQNLLFKSSNSKILTGFLDLKWSLPVSIQIPPTLFPLFAVPYSLQSSMANSETEVEMFEWPSSCEQTSNETVLFFEILGTEHKCKILWIRYLKWSVCVLII